MDCFSAWRCCASLLAVGANCLIAGALLATAMAQPPDARTEKRLKELLRRAPAADTNGDGELTVEEAKQYLKQNGKSATGKPSAGKPDSPGTSLLPTHVDIAYGPHERNKFDLWQVKSNRPTPLVVCIHGGGFRGGDKSKFRHDPVVKDLLGSGVSVAAINYRLTEGGKHPYPAAMLDCARAVQFLRHNADRYQLDPTRVAATGGSAGGCISLWLAFHDDLADPASDDPVRRQSTRLTCAAPNAVPTSLVSETLQQWFQTRKLTEHPAMRPLFALPLTGEVDMTSPQLLAQSRDASPITHLTRDDPPVYLTYGGRDSKVDEQTEPGAWVHHPRTGIKLKEQMDAIGVACHLQYRDVKLAGDYANSTDFLIRTLNGASTRPAKP